MLIQYQLVRNFNIHTTANIHSFVVVGPALGLVKKPTEKFKLDIDKEPDEHPALRIIEEKAENPVLELVDKKTSKFK